MLEDPHPDEIERSRWEVDHVARAFAAVDAAAQEGWPFDVLHDHTGYAALAMADRLDTPVVHTVHGPFGDDNDLFYEAHGHKATIVCISHAQRAQAPREVPDVSVVHNPLDFSEWSPSTQTSDAVLWMGRMAPVKGPDRAITAAREAGVPLELAGPVQPGQEEFFEREVEPHFDGDAVHYMGEVGADDKADVYRRSRALLMPIRWAEPFGMVMVEAMACGTPVIAFREGSAPEIIDDGVTGFLVDDEHEMARAIGRLGELDRARCRERAEERFDVSVCVDRYEEVYEHAALTQPRRTRTRFQVAARACPPPRAPRTAG